MGGGPSSRGKLPNVLSLDHFELERILGEGGFGKVHAAYVKDNSPFRPPPPKNKANKIHWFAIKQITKEKALRSLEEVMLELQLLKDVHHPFLCNAHHAFQDPHYLYLVMDCALGGDLDYHLKKSKAGLKTNQVLFYAMQLGIALDYLHTQQIIHRDLKPGNILLLETGFIKLTDMGICGRLTNGICTDRSGTPGYMCPQRLSGEGIHGPPSDWFSLGVVLHQLLCKTRPFDNKAFNKEAMADMRNGKAPFPAVKIQPQLLDGCTEDMIALLRNLMEFKVENRIKCLQDFRGSAVFKPEQLEWHWDLNVLMSCTAPFVPDTNAANIVTNKEELISGIGLGIEKSEGPTIPESEQSKFDSYELNNKIVKRSVRSVRSNVSSRLISKRER